MLGHDVGHALPELRRVRTILSETVSEAGRSQITAQRMTCAVSESQAGVEVGHRLVVTASDDASLVGRHLYVRAIPRGTDMVLRRLTVTDVQEQTDVDPVRRFRGPSTFR